MASLASKAASAGQKVARTRPHWQAAMADAVTDPAQLCRLLDLPEPTAATGRATEGFSLLVPQPYIKRMRPGDPSDPLLLQVMPRKEELEDSPQFTDDPLAEGGADACRGLLWKYPNRALIVTTGACGVHCRFCFRRHFPYPSEGMGEQGAGSSIPSPPAAAGGTDRWEPAIERIAAERSIREVILSGGDPLTLDDATLGRLASRLARIGHLTRLRIHTRMPIVIPDRVTGDLRDWLRGTRLSPILVLHVNHAREIDGPVAAALSRLADAGVPLLAQTVLLRGVNDRAEVLAELCQRLADHRVMPYYLHQLDRVAGAAHFEVSETAGRALLAELRARLPGYIVPRYVREMPGEPSKRVLA